MLYLTIAYLVAMLLISFIDGLLTIKPVFTAYVDENGYSGLKIVIPDHNFTLFSFHGKINGKTVALKTGEVNKKVYRRPGGMWIMDVVDKSCRFNIGDTLQYSIYAVGNGPTYRKDTWKVKEFDNINAITNLHPSTKRPLVTEPSYKNEEMIELEEFEYRTSKIV